MASDVSIEMKKLGKRYGRTWILSHLSLSFKKGESVALFGNNGSGKSTLLKMIALLLSPSTGDLTVLGRNVEKEREEIRSRLCFLGHNKQLYDRLTVMENLKLVAGIRGIAADNKRLEGYLDRLDILKARDKKVQQLSEGMKKRLVLARLLLGEPELILLDEPHPTLDLMGRRILSELIQTWRENGKTILLASHDHNEALSHVDRLLILQKGHVTYDGTPIDPEKILNHGAQS